MDDIDRLDSDEIRIVFKLVRLVADFPNVSYVLAFDRPRVEQALGNREGDVLTGRAYLAKIVQAAFDLPPIEASTLRTVLLQELDRCVGGRSHGPFHKGDWEDIFIRIVQPLVKTPRDVRRYVNGVAPTVDMLQEEVALEDTLALEAVRVFLPDVHDALAAHVDVLTMNSIGVMPDRHGDRAAATARVQTFIKLGGDSSGVVEQLCKRVFPMSRFAIDKYSYDGSWLKKWRRQRRVACSDVLSIYLERSLRPGTVSATLVRELVAAFSDEHAVAQLLDRLSSDELEEGLSRLEDHIDELAKTAFENGLVAVLRHADRLRSGHSHAFDFGADLVVTRLVLWTLKSTADPGRRSAAVGALLTRTRSLTWRAEILRMLSRSKRDDSKEFTPLFDESQVAEWMTTLKTDVLSSTPEQLAVEREPGLVTWVAYDETTSSYDSRLHDFLRNSTFVRALLASCVSESRS